MLHFVAINRESYFNTSHIEKLHRLPTRVGILIFLMLGFARGFYSYILDI